MDVTPVKYPAFKALEATARRGQIPDLRVALVGKGFDPREKLRSVGKLDHELILGDVPLPNARIEDRGFGYNLMADNARFIAPKRHTVGIGMLIYSSLSGKPLVYVPNSYGPFANDHPGSGDAIVTWGALGIVPVEEVQAKKRHALIDIAWVALAFLLWAFKREKEEAAS